MAMHAPNHMSAIETVCPRVDPELEDTADNDANLRPTARIVLLHNARQESLVIGALVEKVY